MLTLYLHKPQKGVKDQIGANKSNIDIISDLENLLEKSSDSKILLTADDGYKEVLNLVPMLEYYQVKLIFFIATGFVQGKCYPYEMEISSFLEKKKFITVAGKECPLKTLNEKESMFTLIHGLVKPLTYIHRERFLNNLAIENGYSREESRNEQFVTFSDLKQLSEHPLVEIGSHCHRHLFLPAQNVNVILSELLKSKRILERTLKKRVDKIAYPYGGSTMRIEKIAKICGYKKGYGTHNQMEYSKMNQPRLNLQDAGNL